MFYCGCLVPVKETTNRFINPCGTDYGMYVNLTTLRGVENRISKLKVPAKVTRLVVYEFSEYDKFNFKSWRVKCFYNVYEGRVYTAIRHMDTNMIIDS